MDELNELIAANVAAIRRLCPELGDYTRCDRCNIIRRLDLLHLTHRERVVCNDDESCSSRVAAQRSAHYEAVYRDRVERATLQERGRIPVPRTRL